MPIGGYPDFAACVLDQKKKGKSEESAKKICGALEQQARLKGASLYADFTDYSVNEQGDLYLKYFLADDTFTVHKWALNLDKINDAIGKPFTRQIPNNLSLLGDGHPWNRADGAGYDDHLRYANSIKQGEIVDISNVSQGAIKSAATAKGSNVKNGRFASIKITDKNIAQQYIKDPTLIPRAVSIGIYDHDKKDLPFSVIDNYNVVHLAPVEAGAYGPKATLYATCNGIEQKCVEELKGASFTSLVNSDDKNNITMSVNNADSQQSAQQQTEQTNNAPVQNSNTNSKQVTTPQAATKPTGVLRLKTQQQQQQKAPVQQVSTNAVPTNTNTNTQQNQNQNQTPIEQNQNQPQAPVLEEKDITQTPEFQKLQQEVNELKQQRELAVKREKIARLIPMQLFIDPKGKFNQEEFGREVDRALSENWSEASITQFYNTKLDHLNLLNSINNGTQYVPVEFATTAPTGPEMGVGMKGASANQYKTNSEVAEIKGASASDVNSLGITALNGLSNMISIKRGDA